MEGLASAASLADPLVVSALSVRPREGDIGIRLSSVRCVQPQVLAAQRSVTHHERGALLVRRQQG